MWSSLVYPTAKVRKEATRVSEWNGGGRGSGDDTYSSMALSVATNVSRGNTPTFAITSINPSVPTASVPVVQNSTIITGGCIQ